MRGGAARRAAHKLGLLRGPERFEVMARLAREGPLPLVPPRDGLTDSAPMRIAILIPDFHRGSGGLGTILALARGLAAKGHDCSLWFEDPRRRGGEDTSDVKERLAAYFGRIDVAVHPNFESWHAADVVVATGWETVPRALLLAHCAARSYLVQDYEPDFFPASAERRWAEQSYRQGLPHVTAGPWLADLLRERFGAIATHLDLGVDHDVYRPRRVSRRQHTVQPSGRRGSLERYQRAACTSARTSEERLPAPSRARRLIRTVPRVRCSRASAQRPLRANGWASTPPPSGPWERFLS